MLFTGLLSPFFHTLRPPLREGTTYNGLGPLTSITMRMPPSLLSEQSYGGIFSTDFSSSQIAYVQLT